VAEVVPVESLVGDDSLQLIEISGQHLPRDLGVVWQRHRTVNVEIALLSQSTNSVVFTDSKVSSTRFA
jgi:hypothetical protein